MEDFRNHFNTLAHNYLEALRKSDLPGILSLFSPQGQVESPLYGRLSAADFYRLLLKDTQSSNLELKDTLINERQGTGALYFVYGWTLANDQEVSFEVIDYLRLNEIGQIDLLKIIYDTHQTRTAWQQR